MAALRSPDDLPPPVARAVAGRSAEPIGLGMSSARVFRFKAKRGATLYLKVRRVSGAGPSLAAERDRLLWVAGRLPVPEVVAWADDHVCEFLLMSEVPGRPASDPIEPHDVRRLARAVGESLRRVHELPVAGCPFDARADAWIAEARRNVAAGTVDIDHWEREHPGRTPADVLDDAISALSRLAPPRREAFVHGDACLPNLLFVGLAGPDRPQWGAVDWGLAGAGDPMRDLALAAWSLTWNHGRGFEDDLFAAYGPEATAPGAAERRAWHLLLDELL
ncbi:MAG: aminoglycoside 3'-phosphotransferase [Planctomycetes bacterium]|nr:aminoglycoside 3'-phosphotransferase [Planctomycetota bacterium]